MMALFELGDVFGYQDANDIKILWASPTAPADPGSGEVWLDISTTPIQLKRYNGSSWETIGELPASDLLTLIKTVDGSGSGLDADKLDGMEASQFMRGDTDCSFSGTLTSTIGGGPVIKFDNGGAMITVHAGMGNLSFQSGVNENQTITDGDGASHIRIDHTGKVKIAVSNEEEGNTFQENVYLEINPYGIYANDYIVWHAGNDGSGSGLDADKLDGQEGSYYRNASNLDSGTIPSARLSAGDLLTLIKTVDGSGSGLDADFFRSSKILTGSAAGSTTGQWNAFPEAFSQTPRVVCTPRASGSGVPFISSITTTGFTLTTPTSNKFCDYIAIG
jgi:hypothetical protein